MLGWPRTPNSRHKSRDGGFAGLRTCPSGPGVRLGCGDNVADLELVGGGSGVYRSLSLLLCSLGSDLASS